MPHPGNIQRQAGALSTSDGWRCPCSLLGGWTRWPLNVSSNPNCSIILCFDVRDKTLICVLWAPTHWYE